MTALVQSLGAESRKKLSSERSVARAIDYVLYGQGDDLPDFGD